MKFRAHCGRGALVNTPGCPLGPVMVDFTVNLSRPQYPDIWSNINVDFSVKVFFRWDYYWNQ